MPADDRFDQVVVHPATAVLNLQRGCNRVNGRFSEETRR